MAFSIKNYTNRMTLADVGLAWIILFSIAYPKLLAIGFMIMIISLLFKRNTVDKSTFISFFSKGPVLFFLLYYMLLVVGLLWTSNYMYALSKLENKMSFVLFPVLFLFTVRKWGKSEWKQLFVYALFFTLLMYEILALKRHIGQSENSWQFEFLSSRFSFFIHRSYFACYLVIGIIFLFENIKKTVSIAAIALICFFSIGVLQTESKAGILCLFLVFIFQFFSLIKSRNNKFNWVMAFSFLLFSAVLFTNNPVSSRFNTMFKSIETIQTKNNNSVESTTARVIMWNTSLDVWKENLIVGTGTGDYDDELTKKNLQYHNYGVAKEHLNSHNQFLNVAVQLGIFGFIVLIMIFFSSYYSSDRSFQHVLILLVFVINFMVESFLETQAGIVLFCTLLILLFTPVKPVEFSEPSTL